jgi:hypothetical protein
MDFLPEFSPKRTPETRFAFVRGTSDVFLPSRSRVTLDGLLLFIAEIQFV